MMSDDRDEPQDSQLILLKPHRRTYHSTERTAPTGGFLGFQNGTEPNRTFRRSTAPSRTVGFNINNV